METNVFELGRKQPVLALGFKQFNKEDAGYRKLVDMLRPSAFSKGRPRSANQRMIRFSKPSIAEVNHVFTKCHQHIHQSDKISQAKGSRSS